MKPEDMSDEQLAKHLDWVNTVESREAARRLREKADYKAEAMAWREAMDTGVIEIGASGEWGVPTKQDDEDFEPVRKIRAANEAKEAGR